MQAALRLAILSLVLSAACSPAKNPEVEALQNLSVDQKQVLTIWLSKNEPFRPTKDQECNCNDDIKEIRQEGLWGKPVPHYHPYLLTGDFNRDKHPDFVIVLTNKEKPGRRTLAIFNGSAGSQSSDAAFTLEVDPSGVLYYEQERPLSFGIGFTDNLCVLTPTGLTYKPDCLSGDYG